MSDGEVDVSLNVSTDDASVDVDESTPTSDDFSTFQLLESPSNVVCTPFRVVQLPTACGGQSLKALLAHFVATEALYVAALSVAFDLTVRALHESTQVCAVAAQCVCVLTTSRRARSLGRSGRCSDSSPVRKPR